ncbi:hypothetical protein JZK55_10090 [Dissulfurispira thermophila]|uniref:Flagellar protein FlaG n=2 Tax=root TaxID=1 RepID=A0A7G1H2Z0_9BACT|nr:flagellar protein FlaG [Dissulfurispira thermophila]BCB96087.1 hypothetical protein JZK55_10090 [Dissulfurispira thermophila]
MKIEGIIQNINTPVVREQIEGTANNSADVNSRTAGNNISSLIPVSAESIVRNRQKAGEQKNLRVENVNNEIFNLKAVFAVDKEKNVVIRFLDKKGKIVRQVPPEEYINMVKKFRENIESLFSKEV